MMLLQLLPDNIARQWPVIAESIKASMPPFAPSLTSEQLAGALQRALVGDLQVWVMCEETSAGVSIDAIGTTLVSVDQISKEQCLLIYSLTGFGLISEEKWRGAWETLRQYAREIGCSKVMGFTDNPTILHVVDMLGGQTSCRFVELEV